MTTPQPALPTLRTSLAVDLTSLPLLRPWSRKLSGLLMANNSTRREAKLLLYREIAESLRQGIALDVALGFCAAHQDELIRRRPAQESKGAAGRDGYVQFMLLPALMMQLYVFGMLLYSIVAFRAADPERVARLLALRLHARVSQGMSLSEAMERHPRDFSADEVAIVRAGEEGNRLPGALANLSRFLMLRNRIGDQGSVAFYPVILLVCGGIVAFHGMRSLKGYAAVFGDVRFGFSSHTRFLFQLFDTLWMQVVFGFVLPFALLMIIARTFMNGRPLSIYIFAASLLPLSMFLSYVLASIYALSMTGYQVLSPSSAERIALLVCLPIGVITLPWYLDLAERVVLWIETKCINLFAGFPIIGTGAVAEREARWLAALACSIEAGGMPHEALKSAANASSGRVHERTHAAAVMVEGGFSIGEACETCRVPSERTAAMIRFAERSDNFVGRLRDVATDCVERAEYTSERCGRTVQLVSVVLASVVVLMVLSATYAPLHGLPRLIAFR